MCVPLSTDPHTHHELASLHFHCSICRLLTRPSPTCSLRDRSKRFIQCFPVPDLWFVLLISIGILDYDDRFPARIEIRPFARCCPLRDLSPSNILVAELRFEDLQALVFARGRRPSDEAGFDTRRRYTSRNVILTGKSTAIRVEASQCWVMPDARGKPLFPGKDR